MATAGTSSRADLRRSLTRPTAKVGADFIPHVQGLRAIAVLAVVLYHFWPGRLSGGYVGVDIFFVISGFLITAHLARELTSTGTVKLGQFWARRARRLLPASLLVLLFCAIVAAVPVLSPLSQLPAQLKEIVASTFYVENWYLAFNSADYLAHSGDPTMVQHYWSLSLEEQFYVLWPLIMLLAAWIAVKYFRGTRLRAAAIAIAVVSVASFAFCVWYTLTNPAPAYFVTFGRMWQFGVGALLALVPRLRIHNPIGSFILGWGGIITLLVVIYRFDGQTPFPGYMAAIPTVAAGAVIAASNTQRWWYPTRILAVRPMRFTGDISYSLYLWHWPLIIIAPSVPFWGLTIYHRVALVGICFLLAWLTKRLVEDPARTWKPLTARRPRVSLWAALAAMVIVAGAAGGGWVANASTYDQGVQAIAQLRANPPACFGAAVVLDASCADTSTDRILPAPGFAGVDRPADTQCFVQLNDARPVSCEFGSEDPKAKQVALIGDSHAFQLLTTFQGIAEREGWHLTTYFKGACPWSTTPLSTGGAFGDACTQYRAAVAEQLQKKHFDVIFTAALSTTPFSANGHESVDAAAIAGYRAAWATQTANGTPVVTVVDNPVWETDPNKCLRTRPQSSCDGARSDLLTEKDPLREAAAGQKDVTLLDFTDVYCDKTICRTVVGGANIYRDQDHLTVTFVNTLAPQYTAALKKAMGLAG
ncbi:acyltransferase family protein [Microbacterium capsulatum]|uniref:Acyltransferase family protein n=1 Tax=Microbacterium capsulatum TaxID=3041921 RepID=A0ABU0XC14_9MICO|nr:acyltransferase family protein [Microbacterium sp. ASV81]MDQ4212651.1 acyltransferase family protein [Microbacterium sp. ASV81]